MQSWHTEWTDVGEAAQFDERNSLGLAMSMASALREQEPDSVEPISHIDRLLSDRVARAVVAPSDADDVRVYVP